MSECQKEADNERKSRLAANMFTIKNIRQLCQHTERERTRNLNKFQARVQRLARHLFEYVVTHICPSVCAGEGYISEVDSISSSARDAPA